MFLFASGGSAVGVFELCANGCSAFGSVRFVVVFAFDANSPNATIATVATIATFHYEAIVVPFSLLTLTMTHRQTTICN